MPNLEQTLKKHAPYLGALRKVTEYMKFFCGRSQGEPPYRHLEVSRYLVIAIKHVFESSDCPKCRYDPDLHEIESVFLAAYAICSELDGYAQWSKRFGIKVTISDADDEEPVDDPLAWVANPLAGRRLDGILTRFLRTKRRIETEEIKTRNRPRSKNIGAVN
jgi:hypothetical protein